jgi:hypothetical protein
MLILHAWLVAVEHPYSLKAFFRLDLERRFDLIKPVPEDIGHW